MGTRIATVVERIINRSSDRNEDWWPFVRCRPQKTERFGRQAILAQVRLMSMHQAIILLAGILGLMILMPLSRHHVPVISLAMYIAWAKWIANQPIVDVVLCATAAVQCWLLIGMRRWAWDRRAETTRVMDTVSSYTQPVRPALHVFAKRQ